MILFLRTIPFLVLLASSVAFWLLFWQRELWGVVLTAIAALILMAFLAKPRLRVVEFWAFFGLPTLFFLSSLATVFYLQSASAAMLLATAVGIILFVFLERVFFYVHAPALHRAYALEYLSVLMALLTIFFLSVALLGLRLFVLTPSVYLVCAFALLSFALSYLALWASKFEIQSVRLFSFAFALLLAQGFLVVLFLPTEFYTGGAFLALAFYLLFGLSRAHLLHKLDTRVRRRYVVLSICLFVLLSATARWV